MTCKKFWKEVVIRFLTVAAVVLACAIGLSAQIPAPTPTPVTESVDLSIGAAALGLGLGNSQASAATDVKLTLNPGFSAKNATVNAFVSQMEFRSDNLLSPNSNVQYYGGGVNLYIPKRFSGTLAPLMFYTDITAGVSRISPANGNAKSSFGFMGGGGAKWVMANGVQLHLFELNLLHTPNAPWGNSAPALSGGISYLFGRQK